MARAKYALSNSGEISLGAGAAKVVLEATAPSAAPMEITKNPTISFNGTSATDGKILVEAVRGSTSGSGDTVNPVARNGNNPTSTTGPTGKENYGSGTQPTGGTVIWADYVEPYRCGFPIPIAGTLLAPGERIGIRCNSPTSKSCRANFPDLEV